MTISVVVADAHEVVRVGLRYLFAETDLKIVAETDNGRDAIELVKNHQPNLVVMDVRLPKVDGLDVQEKIRDIEESRSIFLTAYSSPTYIARAVALGAADYVNKNNTQVELLKRFSNVADGGACPAGSVLDRFRQSLSTKPKPLPNLPLTARELQVLRHIAMGLSNREIGFALSISVETVKEHVQNILRKSDCTDRTQAAVWTVRSGLVRELETTWPMQ